MQVESFAPESDGRFFWVFSIGSHNSVKIENSTQPIQTDSMSDSSLEHLIRRRIILGYGRRWTETDQKPHWAHVHGRAHLAGGMVYLTRQEERALYAKNKAAWNKQYPHQARRRRRGKVHRFRPEKVWRFQRRSASYPIIIASFVDTAEAEIDAREMGLAALDAHMIPDLAGLVMAYVGGAQIDPGRCANCASYDSHNMCPGRGTSLDHPADAWTTENWRQGTCHAGHRGCDGVHFFKTDPSIQGQLHAKSTLFEYAHSQSSLAS